ncbi:BLUF domain-containing protein [Cytophagales bacterium LB-30]|uniref:BLUF domain-containing protein n=1 Tax=Shiella aurantiaca TaxID=3058365 RepID=A0ABT8F7Y5_9BACT|nr:BLUF domain-containing protein [Shiella aurantiaca]MDN4166591.1 BLUF domain-containing protein [Shiella aurantiaca]
MLSQLVYVSNRKPNCTEEEIEKILEACKKNNPPLDITGVLLYNDTKFIQMVEGDMKTITSLYDKIKGDTRHDQVRMISLGPIKQKSFPSWHMGSRPIQNSNSIDYLTDITSEDKLTFKKILDGEEENGGKVLDILKKFF